jgi:hypothetical protein
MSEFKYSKQYHYYHVFTAAENTAVAANGEVCCDARCPFVAKKIKINFSYSISASSVINYIVTADVVGGDIVASLCKFQYNGGANLIWAADSFKQDNVFSYIFREPQQVGSITFRFNELVGANTIVPKVVVHVEFLG